MGKQGCPHLEWDSDGDIIVLRGIRYQRVVCRITDCAASRLNATVGNGALMGGKGGSIKNTDHVKGKLRPRARDMIERGTSQSDAATEAGIAAQLKKRTRGKNVQATVDDGATHHKIF